MPPVRALNAVARYCVGAGPPAAATHVTCRPLLRDVTWTPVGFHGTLAPTTWSLADVGEVRPAALVAEIVIHVG